MDSVYVGGLIGALSGLAGAFFSSTLSHIYSVRREKRKELREAAADFRSALVRVLLRVESSKDINAPLYLLEFSDEIERAKILFRYSLGGKIRAGFDKEWGFFYNFAFLLDSGGEEADSKRAKQQLVDSINRLLTFTEVD